MKLYQKPFFRSGLFRALLLLVTALLALGFLACGVGTVYNMAVGSYGTSGTVDFADSPLCSSLVSAQMQQTWHTLIAQVNSTDRHLLPVVTQPPMPMPDSTPTPRLAAQQTIPPTATADASASAGAAPYIPATQMPMSTPVPADSEAVMMITPTPSAAAEDRPVLTDEMRSTILATLTKHLQDVDDEALVFTLYDRHGQPIATSDDTAEDLRTRDTWCLVAYLELNRYGGCSYSLHYGVSLQDQLSWLQAETVSDSTLPVILTASLRTVLPSVNGFAQAEMLHYSSQRVRAALSVAALVFLVAFILALSLLLSAAGRRRADEAFHRSIIDRIPTDLFLCGMGLLSFYTAVLLMESIDGFSRGSYLFGGLVCGLCTIVLILLTLMLLMSISVRIKTKTLWKNSLCALLLRGAGWCIRSIDRLAEAAMQNLRLLWQLLLVAGGYLVLTLYVLATQRDGIAMLWMFLSAVGLLLLCYFAIQLDRLREGAKRMRAGSLSEKIPLAGLYGACRAHAEDLNSLADGLGRAVEARIKSERMKTDLITNVSHDLKTPLTSIVNYVELLKTENLENETAAGYVEVLDRQAQRLKKLTADIVDASKAQSGALNVTLAPTDLAELLRQCIAEYEDRLTAVPLVSVVHAPETLMATADGRLLFRTLDNLLGNAVKYAMPNTRLYLDAYADENRACICLKNISREALNIPADELTARFVRGDASRSTEGSGLGLSIAEDLMRLQGGKLLLTVDGDLFRAVIELPLVQ